MFTRASGCVSDNYCQNNSRHFLLFCQIKSGFLHMRYQALLVPNIGLMCLSLVLFSGVPMILFSSMPFSILSKLIWLVGLSLTVTKSYYSNYSKFHYILPTCFFTFLHVSHSIYVYSRNYWTKLRSI